MRQFIFLTSEGETFTPYFSDEKEGGEDSSNCQVLGYGIGASPKEAFNDLEKNNGYLLETTFNEVIAIELKELDSKRHYFLLDDKRPEDEKII